MGNKFVKTHHVGMAVGVLKDIPVCPKKASVTTAISHNNRFMRSKTGDKSTYLGRVHVDTNSLVSWGTGYRDSHAEETGGITSSLVTV